MHWGSGNSEWVITPLIRSSFAFALSRSQACVQRTISEFALQCDRGTLSKANGKAEAINLFAFTSAVNYSCAFSA
jgi:hypothetical protein